MQPITALDLTQEKKIAKKASLVRYYSPIKVMHSESTNGTHVNSIVSNGHQLELDFCSFFPVFLQ